MEEVVGRATDELALYEEPVRRKVLQREHTAADEIADAVDPHLRKEVLERDGRGGM